MADGQTLWGRLAGAKRNWLEVTDSPGAQHPRRVAINEVAMIDFAGNGWRNHQTWRPQSDAYDPTARGRRAEHTLVLRDGRELRGRFLGEGRTVGDGILRLLFREQGGSIVTFAPEEADRLYLSGTAPSSGAGPAYTSQVLVDSSREWSRSNLYVNEGDLVEFSARGDVLLSSNGNDRASPAGAYSGRRPPHGPWPNSAAGALLGRVNGIVFLIGGTTQPVRMPASGELELGVNDDYFGDNRGQFNVTIRTSRDWR
jgi:hypothetical protein